jgi:hypothetical protein
VPNMYFLRPYLSFNRGIFEFQVNTIDPAKIVTTDLVEGVHEIPWEIPDSSSIIVDDLDKDFSTVTEGRDTKGLRLKTKKKIDKDQDTDQGLPYISANILPGRGSVPNEWSRMSNGVAYGKYRHTAAIIKPGDGDKKSLFQTELTQEGAWDLELYMPMKSMFQVRNWGKWHAVVIDNNKDKHEYKFDSNAGIEGWNMVGKLDLPKGNVIVELSNLTDGDIVVADAIRWTPSAGK